MFSRFIHVIACYQNSFSVTEQCSTVCIHHILSIYLFVDRPLRFFHLLAIVNNATLNIGIWVSESLVFGSFGCIPRSRIAGSYRSSLFSFLRNRQNFPTGAVPFCFPCVSGQRFRCLGILDNTCYFLENILYF